MTRPMLLPDALRRAFEPTPRGVVGLVDGLLGLCRGQPLRLDFRDGHCRVHSLGGAAEDVVDVPVPRSVFRAVLARVAALCNERRPDSVTPYGGEGELAVQGEPPTAFQVLFANTPDEQWVEITPTTSLAGGHAVARHALAGTDEPFRD